MVIAELDGLGKSILGQWAENTHAQCLSEARANDPTLVKSGKKLHRYTAFGILEVNEQVLRRGRRGCVFRPFREKIGVGHRACSNPLKRRISDFGAERSGRCTVDALQEHYRIEVPLYTVDKVVREIAKETSADNSERPAGDSAASRKRKPTNANAASATGKKSGAAPCTIPSGPTPVTARVSAGCWKPN